MKKVTFLYEIPLLYALLCGANWLFTPDVPAFIGIDPSPYWIGILLFGIRYGVVAGLLAGLVSVLLYLGGTWFFLERYLFEEFNFYILPCFFLLMGSVMGMLSNRYRLRIGQLFHTAETLKRERDHLKGEIEALTEVNRELEKRIVSRMSTLVTLYEGARKLEQIYLEDLYPSILDFVAKTLGAEEAAFYLKTEEGWQMAHQVGWKEYQRRPRQFKTEEGITGLAGFHGKIFTVRDFLSSHARIEKGAPNLLGDALMAGPVRRGEKGEVVGVLAIQYLPLLKFTSATVSLFNFLLTWASRAVERACYVQNLKKEEILDPEYEVYSPRYFLNRGHQEFLRSKTYSLPLSLGLIRMEGLKELPRKQKIFYLSAVSRLLKECCREMDVVARFEEEGEDYPFAVLWVTASENQASAMKDKILSHYAALDLKGPLPFRLGLATFAPKQNDFGEMVSLVKENVSGDKRHAKEKMA